MQIKELHSGIYKLYDYACKQKAIKIHREKYQSRVDKWEALKKAGAHEDRIPAFVGLFRATYYRDKQRLNALDQGEIPPSKRPARVNKWQWGEAERQLVLRIRRKNLTYGKAKIAVILKRDHDCILNESTVGLFG